MVELTLLDRKSGALNVVIHTAEPDHSLDWGYVPPALAVAGPAAGPVAVSAATAVAALAVVVVVVVVDADADAVVVVVVVAAAGAHFYAIPALSRFGNLCPSDCSRDPSGMQQDLLIETHPTEERRHAVGDELQGSWSREQDQLKES